MDRGRALPLIRLAGGSAHTRKGLGLTALEDTDMHPSDPGHPQNRPSRALSIPLRSAWDKEYIRAGWATYTRGNCRITEAPSGAVMLYAPGCTTEHGTVDSAKRAAATRHNKGW